MGSKRKRQTQDSVEAAPVNKKKQKKTSQPTKAIAPTPIVISKPFLDKPKGPDLKHEVQLYDILSSEDGAERLAAADAVISGLLGGEGVAESTLQRHLERRLFRGLASGRKGARLGFSVVITELLGQLFGEKELAKTKYQGLDFETVSGILIAKTKPEGDLSGQEERDHFLGLLFGLQCFVRANILFQAGTDWWQKVCEALLNLGKKKPWMREECGFVIVEALAQMDQAQAEETIKSMNEAGLAACPEGVGVWLSANLRFPHMKLPSKPWGTTRNPFDHLNLLAKAMKESSSGEDGQQAKQTGTWNPQLHFAWNIVLDEWIVRAHEEQINYEDFETFWKITVDENLFSEKASRERKFWGFLLFQKMLEKGESHPIFLRCIFSNNFMRCLLNQLANEDRFLHKAAEKSLKCLQNVVDEHPSIVPHVLPKLIGDGGAYNFDQVTKTKTVDKMISQAVQDSAAAGLTVNALLEPALKLPSGASDRDVESRRQNLGDYLLIMIRRINIVDASKNTQWVEKGCLPLLANFAYTKGEAYKCSPEISDRTRTIFRTRLASAFAHLVSDPTGFLYPCDLLKTLQPTAVAMDERVTEAKDQALAIMLKILEKAKKPSEQRKQSLRALALLFALVIFQLYNGEPDAISVLEELKLCYDTLVPSKSKPKKGQGDTEEDSSQVLVEILLSFMSKTSALLRKVAQLVFTAFVGDITTDGLKLMTDVLESSESLKGQQALFDQEEEGNEEEGDSDEEMDSDVEVVDVDQANGDLESDNDNDEEEEDEDDDLEDEEVDDDEIQKLDAALAAALGTHRIDQDVTAGSSSDSDADMTDSEMLALDSKLVEIFSQRKKVPNKKQEKKDARETVINFKNRVLDLLEVYVKKQPSNPLAFTLLLPLLQLMRSTTTKQISEKAYGVIVALAKALKNAKVDSTQSTQDEKTQKAHIAAKLVLLKDIHAEAAKDPSHAFARAASTASLLVATNVYRVDKKSGRKVANVYRDSMVEWMTGEVRMQASFFHDWVNWCQSHVAAG